MNITFDGKSLKINRELKKSNIETTVECDILSIKRGSALVIKRINLSLDWFQLFFVCALSKTLFPTDK